MNCELQSLEKLQLLSHPAITLSPLEDPLLNPLIAHIFSQTYILKASLNYSQYVLAQEGSSESTVIWSALQPSFWQRSEFGSLSSSSAAISNMLVRTCTRGICKINNQQKRDIGHFSVEQKTKPKRHWTRIKLANSDHILNYFQRRFGKGTEAMQRMKNQQCMP